MSRATAKDTAVIIPARNEEDRITACLAALGGQNTARVTVILVVNNSADRTSTRARDAAARHGLQLALLERTLAPDQGVGAARQIGCDHALRHMPDLRYLLTTDADCIVAGDWIDRNLTHLQTVDAVCGKVDLIVGEADLIEGMDPHLATLEGAYRELVQDIYAHHGRGCADIGGTHGDAAGASLAFSKTAYLAVGGFAPILCGEDRLIVRTLRTADRKVRHANDVTVQASCRLTGRAVGGMSDALKARISSNDYMIDDALPAAHWLVRQAIRRTLGPWPPQVPARFRLNVRDLPRHIVILEDFKNSGRLIPALIAPSTALPFCQLGMPSPGKGSEIIPSDPDLQASLVLKSTTPATTQTKPSAVPTANGASNGNVERSLCRRTSGSLVRE